MPRLVGIGESLQFLLSVIPQTRTFSLWPPQKGARLTLSGLVAFLMVFDFPVLKGGMLQSG